ncbi:MAG: hypothetical protein R3Y67_07805 [Eubacteriales bacterium]
MKKIIILVSLVVGILITSAFIFYHHTANNPQHFEVLEFVGNSEDSKFTHMSFAYATAFNIPISEKLRNNLFEIVMWNDSVISEVMLIDAENDNLNVGCTYHETKTQTTVTYQGTYVDENDETIEYFNEKTFDFVLPVTENQLVE